MVETPKVSDLSSKLKNLSSYFLFSFFKSVFSLIFCCNSYLKLREKKIADGLETSVLIRTNILWGRCSLHIPVLNGSNHLQVEEHHSVFAFPKGLGQYWSFIFSLLWYSVWRDFRLLEEKVAYKSCAESLKSLAVANLEKIILSYLAVPVNLFFFFEQLLHVRRSLHCNVC